jgi:hypothetical protein
MNANKKFCKVCFDAKKDESVYTSHTVKSKDVRSGKMVTTCVTLLALECRYCFKSGHTVKFCETLKENERNRQRHEIERARFTRKVENEQNAAVAAKNAKPVAKKGFALLDEEELSSHETNKDTFNYVKEVEVVDNFPSLITKNSGNSQTKSVFGYALAASAQPAAPPKKINVKPLVKAVAADNKRWVEEDDSDYEEKIIADEPMSLEEQYGDRMYEILCDYFRNEKHQERIATIVGKLLESSKEELDEFITNRLYLEERADEIYSALQEFDPPAKGCIYYRTEVEDW